MSSAQTPSVTIVGAGLAGSECAYQLSRLGISVCLYEMKPIARSPAHKSDQLAELVCSNSFRSDNPESAIGLLHSELRSLGSVILRCADRHRVPAGEALAVNRDKFSGEVTAALLSTPMVSLRREQVQNVPAGLAVIATGPLTSEALATELEQYVGRRIYFYDAIAPIVASDSIDTALAFRQSRYNKGGGDDYLNLPLSREEYQRFVQSLRSAERVVPHSFEEPRYFEGCLPIEVMADRGEDVLAYGPMKPVGLRDPRTGRQPHAVVQLRPEDRAASSYNLVGFQTRLTWKEQKRVFAQIPGLEHAEFLRMGQIHRNTFIDAPRLLAADLSLRAEPRLFFAGQITGVEGYVESAACGFLVALAVCARLGGQLFVPPPGETALGALYRHISGEAHPENYEYQPSNIIFGLFPPLPGRVKRQDKRARYAQRARESLAQWLATLPRVMLEPSEPNAEFTVVPLQAEA
jgi:methylenetetrahydrofolate--tRNA-(uracil-5-)-methyltransferase